MNWTTEYPTQPGFYWIRNYQLEGWTNPQLPPNIAMVEQDMDFYLPGVEDFFSRRDVLSAQWLGPIQPPVEPQLELDECMLGGHQPGCRCHIIPSTDNQLAARLAEERRGAFEWPLKPSPEDL